MLLLLVLPHKSGPIKCQNLASNEKYGFGRGYLPGTGFIIVFAVFAVTCCYR